MIFKNTLFRRFLITKNPQIFSAFKLSNTHKKSIALEKYLNERMRELCIGERWGWHPDKCKCIESRTMGKKEEARRERSRGTMIFDLCASWAAGRKRNYCNQDLFQALYCHNTADLPAVISRPAQVRLER